MSTSAPHREPLLMTQSEAAVLLGVSRNTVIRLVRKGVLPTTRLAPGMARLVRRADVIALAERK